MHAREQVAGDAALLGAVAEEPVDAAVADRVARILSMRQCPAAEHSELGFDEVKPRFEHVPTGRQTRRSESTWKVAALQSGGGGNRTLTTRASPGARSD